MAGVFFSGTVMPGGDINQAKQKFDVCEITDVTAKSVYY